MICNQVINYLCLRTCCTAALCKQTKQTKANDFITFFFILSFRFLSNNAMVNFSPKSLQLLITYPHREEVQGIAMASLFLKLMLLKVLPNQLKIFVNLTFSPKV